MHSENRAVVALDQGLLGRLLSRCESRGLGRGVASESDTSERLRLAVPLVNGSCDPGQSCPAHGWSHDTAVAARAGAPLNARTESR